MTGHFTSYKTRPNHELATRARDTLRATAIGASIVPRAPADRTLHDD